MPLISYLYSDMYIAFERKCVSCCAYNSSRCVNMSLESGTFPDILKRALVTPIIKKPSLDRNVLTNYRPVSNIPFIAKVIESVVASKFKDYLDTHELNESLQSAYRKGHNTKTALLKVQNDCKRALDNNKIVLMVMLDLTAAFDTIDHILFHRLESGLGVTEPPLAWFQSCISLTGIVIFTQRELL